MQFRRLWFEALGGLETRKRVKGEQWPPAQLSAILLLLVVVPGGVLYGQQVPAQHAPDPAASDPRALLEQLNQVSIDPSQVYVLRGARIARDRINIYFNRGFVGFLTQVSGEITGAVFSGEGEVLLMPPDLVEKRNLAQFAQSPILEEQFTSAYLRFTDKTAPELLSLARRPEAEDLEQPTGFVEQWNPLVPRVVSLDTARILQDLLGDRSRPYFHAQFQGKSLGAFEAVEDERMVEGVMLGAVGHSEGRLYGDIWCSMPSRASEGRISALRMGPARVLSYKIDTRINTDHSLEGRAELDLESHSSVDRVLPFELSRRLKLSEVADEKGGELVAFQKPALEESEAAARGNDWVEVVLPSPHPVGEKFRLNFTYQGNVIADVGNGVLYVGAHGSWYPNRGLGERAAYDLTFHYPERLTLVATGSRVEESSSEGWKESRWVSDGEFPVAGFNLGDYESRVRRAGNSTIEVYATGEAETALRKRYIPPEPGIPKIAPSSEQPGLFFGGAPSTTPALVPSALLDRVTEGAARALEYFETLFGPFPYPRLAISQIPGNFGQGWPELVYLPTLSFFAVPEPSESAGEESGGRLASQVVIAHEIAHQWWGNEMGWKTYHDQWLSEGFASYAAALFLAQEEDGERNFTKLLRGYKRDLLNKTRAGNTVESGGPIWLGARLSNSLNPDGYSSIVYKKACWILHMLRMLMTDPVTGSDERFFRMLRDFVAAYRGSNPSTEDFIRHAEKYMTRSSDLADNGRLEWFFNEWVYGSGIPTYELQTTVREEGPAKFVIDGAIQQNGVPENFEMLVPLTATYGKDHKVELGRVVVTGAGGKFRFTATTKPSRVALDDESVLAVVK